MSNIYIVNSTRYERLTECIKKGVYGLSEGMLRKVGSFLKNSCENDILFLKLSTAPQMIVGPFYITNLPKNLNAEKSYGKCFKINTLETSNYIPWWVAEGFNWLIFFKTESESKYAELNENMNIPNIAKLSESTLNKLLQYLKDKGKPLEELADD